MITARHLDSLRAVVRGTQAQPNVACRAHSRRTMASAERELSAEAV
jgi:hypothetical protein